jgi:hypothetical protein
MPRCICKTVKKLRCKNSICALSQCWAHLNQKYYEQILTIQKIWKGYRTRKMYNTVFTRLPQDLQHKVIFYIRENYLIKKHHHDVLQKIIHKKIENISKSIQPNINKGMLNIAELYKLCNKYFSILQPTDIHTLRYKSNNYLYILDRIVFDDYIIENIMFFQHQLTIFT